MWIMVFYGICIIIFFLSAVCIRVFSVLFRITKILSYTQFLSSCEVASRFNEIYRPVIMNMGTIDADAFLHGLENSNLVVGRDIPQSRCKCTREYCLNFRSRRRRKPAKKTLISGIHLPDTVIS